MPCAEIQVARIRHRVTARSVWPTEPAYGQLFGVVNANNRQRYRSYAKKTSRPIPVIVLTPEP